MKNKEPCAMGKGKLFIISAPIGNMEDITHRAVKTLGEVDIIAAEDTRRTRKLLSHYNINNKVISYHDYNEKAVSKKLLDMLLANKDVGLVSDAGTPCISDPGFSIIKIALENDIQLVPIPGPSSILASLVVSGLATDRFVFEGYLPRGKGKKRKKLEDLTSESRTMIFFESPHRIIHTLKEIKSIFENRKIVIAREVTKVYEEIIRAELKDIALEKLKKFKGEITIILEGLGKKKKKKKTKPFRDELKEF